MRVLHPWRLVLSLVAVMTVLLAAWVGWQAWQVTRALSAATADAAELRTAVEAGDDEASDAALQELQRHASKADEVTRSWTWAALSRVPAVGDDARGVRLVAEVVDDLSGDELVSLLRAADGLDTLLPRDGRVSIEAVEALQPSVTLGSASLARANDRLGSADPRGFVGPLRTQYRELAAQVSDASDALSSADAALEVLPTMLGKDGPRRYLLVVQNNAEVRATGGLPGSVSLLDVAEGRIRLTKQVAGSSFGRRDGSVLPLSAAEKELFGSQMGEFFLDANFTPDFPRAAELMAARWEETYPPEDIDGVLSIDPVVLSYVLAAIGPVEVGGVRLDEFNAVDELLNGVYLRFDQPAAQDTFFQAVAKTVFDRVSNGVGSPRTLIEALARGAEEGRVYVRSFDPSETAALAGRLVAGEVAGEGAESASVAVALNDSTGAKMSYYLRTNTRLVSTYCRDGVQGLSGRTTLTSVAPADAGQSLPPYVTGGGRYGVDPGDQLVTIQLFAPAGGAFVDARFNAQPVQVDVIKLGARDVATTYAYLAPGESADIEWRMTSAADQRGPVALRVTPGVEPGTDSVLIDSACD